MIGSRLIILMCLITALRMNGQNIESELTSEISQIAKSSSIEGFGVAIFDKDSSLYSHGFGYSQVENKIPYHLTTVQKVASISKIVLGVAVMKAVELGLLELDDNVNQYLPFPLKNPHFADDIITIRHLATHTAGLQKTKKDLNALYFPSKIGKAHSTLPFGLRKIIFGRAIRILDANATYSLEEFLFRLYDPEGEWYRKKNFSKERAGDKHIYSNTGASFLVLILESASDMNYVDFVREHILNPLQMNDTYFDFEVEQKRHVKTSELFHAGVKIPNDYHLILFPAGGLESSVHDFSKFMSAMVKGYEMGNEILSHSSYKILMNKQFEAEFDQGILWKVHDEYIGHNGDIAGVTTFSYFDKHQGVGYLLFCNSAMSSGIDEEIESIKKVLKESFEKFR